MCKRHQRRSVEKADPFSMLGLYLNKCRTAACFFAEGYPEIKGVCFFKHGLLFRLFLRLHDLGVWSVQRIMEVLEWNRRKNGVFGY